MGMSASPASFWALRPTFVTGGTGLVGTAVTKRLLSLGASVVCLVRDWVPESELIGSGALANVTVVRGDVRDQALLERILGEYEIDTVIHLAAQTIVGTANRNPVSTLDTNIAGTWALLEACRRSPLVKQVVVASSDKAYGDQDKLPYREDSPLNGRNPYDASKSCADLISLMYAHVYDVPVVVSRCANFYGEGDLNWNRLIPGTLRSFLRKERPIIRSDGKSLRDYLYVEDVASAYLDLVEAQAAKPQLKGEAFNFSAEAPLTALEVVGLIGKLMDVSLEPDIRNEAKHEIRHQYASAEKARAMIGWRPAYSMEEGLSRTIAWYRQHLGQAPA